MYNKQYTEDKMLTAKILWDQLRKYTGSQKIIWFDMQIKLQPTSGFLVFLLKCFFNEWIFKPHTVNDHYFYIWVTSYNFKAFLLCLLQSFNKIKFKFASTIIRKSCHPIPYPFYHINLAHSLYICSTV